MFKKTVCIIICVIILIIPFSVTASAYEPTGVDLSVSSCIFASLDTGEILYSKEPDKKIYPASITKIMTVLLMLENKKFNPKGKVAMTEEVLKLISGTGSSVSGLKVGEEITELDLAYLVLMSSYGDCAYLAAFHYAGGLEKFVAMMNKRAKELGLKNTHYHNPIGLHDETNYTTATDTLTITKYALQNPIFKEICESTRYTMPATNMSRERTVSTTNLLQDASTNYFYAYAKGVKTGYTDEAGRCLVSTASYNGYNYICILFGCPVDPNKRHEFVYSKELYKWAFNNFVYKEAANAKNPVCEVKIELSHDVDTTPLYLEKDYVTVLPKNADTSTIIIEPHPNKKSFDAPIKKGTVMGTADIIYAERVVGTVNLISGTNIKRSNLLLAFRSIKRFFISKYMIGFYILIGIVVILFIAAVIKLNKGNKNKRKVKYIPYDDNRK